jgi:hypothetical protein
MTTSRTDNRHAGDCPELLSGISSPGIGPNLIGWLIQTAAIAVVEGACETIYKWRGFTEGDFPEVAAKSAFLSHFPQIALISKAVGRKSELNATGYVAGLRRHRRAVDG